MEGNKVVAEISIVPLGTGKAGVSEFVAACIDVLSKRDDIAYRLTPMGTIVEGTLEVILAVTREMHEVPFKKGALRVVTTLKIDDRRDKLLSMEGKLTSVRKRLPSVKT
ncbi:MAG: MTH1187 family thiamine-binding protein [Dehalococcoidia bacterium]|nr:MTH1187 family thiamine-binding protein [Dehalococcoidia bacterium]